MSVKQEPMTETRVSREDGEGGGEVVPKTVPRGGGSRREKSPSMRGEGGGTPAPKPSVPRSSSAEKSDR